MKYVIGNWKSNKTIEETNEWLDTFLSFDFSNMSDGVQVIICPPFPLIGHMNEKTKNVTCVKIGAQDVSHLPAGSYTGEVNASTLSSFVDYCIVGHSERRQNFAEDDQLLSKKFSNAQSAHIEPIYCISGPDDSIPSSAKFVAYEPVEAIGTGQNTPADVVVKMKANLSLPDESIFIYGGSVTDKNVAEYLSLDEIDGVLPGGASLNPEVFFNLAKIASKL